MIHGRASSRWLWLTCLVSWAALCADVPSARVLTSRASAAPPTASSCVAVVGEIARPGVYECRHSQPEVGQLILFAGGQFSERHPYNVRIIHKGKAGQNLFLPGARYQLHDGDVVHVERPGGSRATSTTAASPHRTSTFDKSSGTDGSPLSLASQPVDKPPMHVTLLHVLPRPVVLNIPPDRATLGDLLGHLHQSPETRGNVTLIRPHQPVQNVSYQVANSVPLTTGTILVFDARIVQRDQLPRFAPTLVYDPQQPPPTASPASTTSASPSTSTGSNSTPRLLQETRATALLPTSTERGEARSNETAAPASPSSLMAPPRPLQSSTPVLPRATTGTLPLDSATSSSSSSSAAPTEPSSSLTPQTRQLPPTTATATTTATAPGELIEPIPDALASGTTPASRNIPSSPRTIEVDSLTNSLSPDRSRADEPPAELSTPPFWPWALLLGAIIFSLVLTSLWWVHRQSIRAHAQAREVTSSLPAPHMPFDSFTPSPHATLRTTPHAASHSTSAAVSTLQTMRGPSPARPAASAQLASRLDLLIDNRLPLYDEPLRFPSEIHLFGRPQEIPTQRADAAHLLPPHHFHHRATRAAVPTAAARVPETHTARAATIPAQVPAPAASQQLRLDTPPQRANAPLTTRSTTSPETRSPASQPPESVAEPRTERDVLLQLRQTLRRSPVETSPSAETSQQKPVTSRATPTIAPPVAPHVLPPVAPPVTTSIASPSVAKSTPASLPAGPPSPSTIPSTLPNSLSTSDEFPAAPTRGRRSAAAASQATAAPSSAPGLLDRVLAAVHKESP